MDQSLSRFLRLAVFGLLFVSTLTGLFLSDRLWLLWDVGELPLWAALAPPVLFFCFMVVFAIDRLHAVRARSLPAHRAMFHVGASVLFFMLLLPRPSKSIASMAPRAQRAAVGGTMETRAAQFLLQHEDTAVRAATCLLLGNALQDAVAPDDQPLLELMGKHAIDDEAVSVREACQAALDHLMGADDAVGPLWPLGPASSEPAVEDGLPPGALGDGSDCEDDGQAGDGDSDDQGCGPQDNQDSGTVQL